MPIYEYECQSCHAVVESWQSYKDEPLTTCPDCSGSLKKVISATSFTLKGGGWYADGYSSKSANSASSSCKSSSCTADSSCSAGKSNSSCDLKNSAGTGSVSTSPSTSPSP